MKCTCIEVQLTRMELQVFWIGQLALTLVITKVVIHRLDGKNLKE